MSGLFVFQNTLIFWVVLKNFDIRNSLTIATRNIKYSFLHFQPLCRMISIQHNAHVLRETSEAKLLHPCLQWTSRKKKNVSCMPQIFLSITASKRLRKSFAAERRWKCYFTASYYSILTCSACVHMFFRSWVSERYFSEISVKKRKTEAPAASDTSVESHLYG